MIFSIQGKFDGCQYYDYNYTALAEKSFEEAVIEISEIEEKPKLLPCKVHTYENKDTVVSEVMKICTSKLDF